MMFTVAMLTPALGMIPEGQDYAGEFGRRRAEVPTDAAQVPTEEAEVVPWDLVSKAFNAELCLGAARQIKHNRAELTLGLLNSREENGRELRKIAKRVVEWASQTEEERRRTQTAEEEVGYVEEITKFFKKNKGLDDNLLAWVFAKTAKRGLPPKAFDQARGYALAISELTKTRQASAIAFADFASGNDFEKHFGCAGVVNGVNQAVAAGEIAGLKPAQDEAGTAIVVVEDDTMIDAFGTALTSVVLASGAVAMKLMDTCKYYQQML